MGKKYEKIHKKMSTDLGKANQRYDLREKKEFVPFTGAHGKKTNKRFIALQVKMIKRYAKRKHKLRECQGRVRMYRFGATIDADGKF